jgi:hypothetical protein
VNIQILFLVEIHFSRWHWHRLGINTLKERGVDVKILDLTKWIVPKYYENYKLKIYNCPERIEIDGIDSLNSALHACNADLIIAFDNLGFNSTTSQIRQKIYSEMKALRCVLDLSNLPAKYNFFDRFKDLKSRTRLPLRTINRIRRYFEEKKMGPPDLAMLSGELSVTGPFARATHKILCHSLDYDEFLAVNKIEINDSEITPYAVYLDENIVSGPDLEHCGFKPTTTSSKFYPRINQFFSAIEATIGMPVVIAAHPKANYHLHPNVFGGRDIVLGNTAELVRSSQLVLGHASASLNFPMLWRKPILIMTSDDIENSRLSCYVKARASIIMKKTFNIDRKSWDLNPKYIMSVNNNCYGDYVKKYIKISEESNKSSWEIFLDYVGSNL